MRKIFLLNHDIGDDRVPLIILSKRSSGSLIFYYYVFLTLPGSTWQRRMSNTQKLGLKSMLRLLISITSSSNFSWNVQCTCTMYIGRQVPSKLFALETSWRTKKHKGISGKKNQNSIFKPFCILYIVCTSLLYFSGSANSTYSDSRIFITWGEYHTSHREYPVLAFLELDCTFVNRKTYS